MLLGPTEMEEIARLNPGESFFYTEGLYRPRRVQCLNASSYLQLGEFPTGDQILQYLNGEQWYEEDSETRTESEILYLSEKMHSVADFIEEKRRIVCARGALFPDQWNQTKLIENKEEQDHQQSEIRELLEEILEQIQAKYEQFLQRTYNPIAARILAGIERKPNLQTKAAALEENFESGVAEPYAEMVLKLQEAIDYATNPQTKEIP